MVVRNPGSFCFLKKVATTWIKSIQTGVFFSAAACGRLSE